MRAGHHRPAKTFTDVGGALSSAAEEVAFDGSGNLWVAAPGSLARSSELTQRPSSPAAAARRRRPSPSAGPAARAPSTARPSTPSRRPLDRRLCAAALCSPEFTPTQLLASTGTPTPAVTIGPATSGLLELPLRHAVRPHATPSGSSSTPTAHVAWAARRQQLAVIRHPRRPGLRRSRAAATGSRREPTALALADPLAGTDRT